MMDHLFDALEVCAGGGGQAIGLGQAGFGHAALVEIDDHACRTLRHNRPDWDVRETDLTKWTAREFHGRIGLLAGGVPCPPFSIAGKQLGADDERDLMPHMVRLAREANPEAVLIENVKGILHKRFDNYRAELAAEFGHLGYDVHDWKLLHASDFGVPQLRPRVFLVATKPRYSPHFHWPDPAEYPNPGTVGETLQDLMASNGWAGAAEWAERADKIAPTLVGGSKKHGGPDLGPTRAKRAWAELGVDGMRVTYDPPQPDHQGMPLLSVRMTARLQGFPDDWEFPGVKTHTYRQIGNACPPPLVRAVGTSIRRALRAAASDHQADGIVAA